MSDNLAYLLGTLGLIQAVLLPGFCVTANFCNWSLGQRLIYALPLSLVINQLSVWFLVSLRLYGQISVLPLFALELGWLAFCLRRPRVSCENYAAVVKPLDFLLLLWAVTATGKYFEAWGRNFGDIFQQWDAVASWNYWGTLWASNQIPHSNMYPGGLPETYSIPYAFMGHTDLQSFSKASGGIFFLGALVSLVELGFRHVPVRRIAWMVAVLYPSVQAKFLQSHWNSGYADATLGAMTIFAFSISFMDEKKTPWLFGILASGAALVKQPGLLFAAVSPLLFRGIGSWRALRRTWIKVALAASAAGGPWYAFIFYRIYVLQNDANNVNALSSMVPGGLLSRWAFTSKLLVGYSSLSFLAGGALLVAVGCVVSREARRWVLLFGFPYFLIWGTLFGYDIRNLSMSLFPLALAASAGIVFLLGIAEDLLSRFSILTTLHALWRARAFPSRKLAGFSFSLLLLLIGIGLAKPIGHWIKHGSLAAWEREQRFDLGDLPRANRAFSSHFPCRSETKAEFYTNYRWIWHVADWQKIVLKKNCDEIIEAARLRVRAYALVDPIECSGKAKAAVESLPALVSEDRLRIVALDPTLPRDCTIH